VVDALPEVGDRLLVDRLTCFAGELERAAVIRMLLEEVGCEQQRAVTLADRCHEPDPFEQQGLVAVVF
jgi:hypothetical protein